MRRQIPSFIHPTAFADNTKLRICHELRNMYKGKINNSAFGFHFACDDDDDDDDDENTDY